MEINNIIQRLRKINRTISYNIWHVRIGSIEMGLFFLFVVGEILVGKFVPMESTTQNIVCETLSCISVLILGQAIARSIYKLTARRRWATLTAMAVGASMGLVASIIFDLIDGEVIPNNDYVALGVCIALSFAAYTMWRIKTNRLKQIKYDRETIRRQRLRRGY